jgi:hypothetical protein
MVLLREPRLKSINRGGALNQPPLKIIPVKILLPPGDNATDEVLIKESVLFT